MHADPATTPSRQTIRFGPIDVDFDARILVPRPWTLAQSEWAAELAGGSGGPILELCAGAGHIGLAAAVLADRDLVQVDRDPVAVEYAAFNARRAGWAARVEIRRASLEVSLRPDESFGLILADPPYLPSHSTSRWPDDPLMAIDGGSDGLDLIRVCLRIGSTHLGEGGTMLLQVAGRPQADRVGALVASMPEARLRVHEIREIDDERAVIRLDRS